MKVSSRIREIQESVNLLTAIRQAWCAATCYPPSRDQWTPENPALGQGAVTALLLQELLGGDVVYNSEHKHFWNRLEDGREIDMTLERFQGQFDSTLPIDRTCSREYMLEGIAATEARTMERYQILKARVLERWTSGD